MKKIILMLTVLVFIFSACNKNNGSEGFVDTGPTPGLPRSLPFAAAEDGFVFVFNNVRVVMGAPSENIITSLGEYRSRRVEPSCAFEGYDVTYIYNDFYIECFQFDDNFYVHVVDFTNDNVRTAEGLYIGAGFDDMVKLYGDGFRRDFNMHIYERNGTELKILVEDGVVVQITYYFMILN